MSAKTRPGRAHPLGATYDGHGVNFAVFSEYGTRVELCLFDADGRETRVDLPERTLHVFHGYVPGIRPGQRYGFRVHGAYEPLRGDRFNPKKLLVDPYACAFEGKVDYDAPIYGFAREAGPASDVMDIQDDAAGIPKSIVVDGTFDWGGDAPPEIPWQSTVVYEVHVKGFTKTHPGVPEELRGTYEGMASDAAIAHFRSLGVTTIELLPVHEIMDEPALAKRGMTNYWGYNTLGYFAPEQRYARKPGDQVDEFKRMVKKLHAAGIEVVLDVVYNHSSEGGHDGPTVSFRGLDNRVYYRLNEADPRLYADYTGCGNSLNTLHPQTLKLIMDSLRYWVTEMHVDGFRFDLASTLGRERHEVDRLSAFFDIIHQDPVLSRTKLIAEPWDLGEGGYQVGNFPVLWTEWNGKYRDTVRRFWKGDVGALGDLGFRLTGSSDLFQAGGRHAHASINFVTAHDGFTLRDLVTYEKKRNLENGEGNRDGWDDNIAWNCGVEGETDDEAIRELRARQQRNFLATLVLSQGVPMLTSGDEISKTQRGNNNPYCQDNERSWVDWTLDAAQEEQRDFVRALLGLRASHPVFRRKDFFRGELVRGSARKDIAWFRADGKEMGFKDWVEPKEPFLALLLAGDALDARDSYGVPVVDDTFLLVMNGSASPKSVVLPGNVWGDRWAPVVDTRSPTLGLDDAFDSGDTFEMESHSLVVFVRVAPASGSWRAPPR
ncbi:MAG: glycogen debranching protein GlgX [Polyangiaceae bacterium]